MTDAIELPLGRHDRLYEPPLIDHFNREPNCFAIEFIPPDDVAKEEKCFVNVPADSPDGRRIGVLLERIEELSSVRPIRQIVHSGGGNYSLRSAQSSVSILQDLDHEAAIEVADRIHHIAEAALYAHVVHERHSSRSA